MRNNSAYAFVLAFASVQALFVACTSSGSKVGAGGADSGAEKPDSGGPDAGAQAAGCTDATPFVGGAVVANRTLTKACSPYAISSAINVDGNATLTIEAGVTLNFAQNLVVNVGAQSAAKLVANGTAASPIKFTSANSTPGAGDWEGIKFWGGVMNGSSISYSTLDYCGQSASACIHGQGGVKTGRVTVDHATISHIGNGANGIQEDDVASNFTISNCTFNNVPNTQTQRYAISVLAPSFAGIDSTNTFNAGAMIELAGDAVSATTDWRNPGAPVAVTSKVSLDGATAPVLTIAAGTTFKFARGTSFDVGYSSGGNLKANETATT